MSIDTLRPNAGWVAAAIKNKVKMFQLHQSRQDPSPSIKADVDQMTLVPFLSKSHGAIAEVGKDMVEFGHLFQEIDEKRLQTPNKTRSRGRGGKEQKML